jgi:biopolymer transport protein ExbD
MAPLIDVVFLLLTFFVFAMLMMVRAQVLDITLPALGAGEPAPDVAAVTISLDAAGAAFVDGEEVAREGLIGAIRAKLDATPDARLYLAADTGGSSGDLLEIIDLLSRNGFGDFQLFGTPQDAGASTPAAPEGRPPPE